MIYDIVVINEDEEYKDIELTAAFEDYADATWKVVLTLFKEKQHSELCNWEYSPDSCSHFDELRPGDVPDWFRNLANYLKPRMIEMLDKAVGTRVERFVSDNQKNHQDAQDAQAF